MASKALARLAGCRWPPAALGITKLFPGCYLFSQKIQPPLTPPKGRNGEYCLKFFSFILIFQKIL